jgi:hypothetical protein
MHLYSEISYLRVSFGDHGSRRSHAEAYFEDDAFLPGKILSRSIVVPSSHGRQ